jgi:uncharacterized protein (TIGR02001 family)
MKTLSKAVAVASLLSAGVMGAQVANAEVSFNAAAVSDYVWRGQTQNDNGFALQGGADYDHESGLSAGIWASTVYIDADEDEEEDFIEVDLYASYGFDLGGVDASFGFINYQYDESDSSSEVNASVAKDAFSAMASVAVDADDDEGYTYLEGSYGAQLPEDLSLDLTLGYNIPEASGADNSLDFTAVLSKSLAQVDVAIGVAWASEERTDDDDSETVAFLAVSKEF